MPSERLVRGGQAGPRGAGCRKCDYGVFLFTLEWWPLSFAPRALLMRRSPWPRTHTPGHQCNRSFGPICMHARACVRLQASDTCSWLACHGEMACLCCSPSWCCGFLGYSTSMCSCVHAALSRHCNSSIIGRDAGVIYENKERVAFIPVWPMCSTRIPVEESEAIGCPSKLFSFGDMSMNGA